VGVRGEEGGGMKGERAGFGSLVPARSSELFDRRSKLGCSTIASRRQERNVHWNRMSARAISRRASFPGCRRAGTLASSRDHVTSD